MFAKKSLGQNFLINSGIIRNICDQIDENSIVLEIGGGKGALTKKISEKVGKENIIVVEKDDRFINLLSDFANVVHQDVLQYDFSHLLQSKKEVVIIGNLPYNISTQILFDLIEKINLLRINCKKLILMFQREVADRIISPHNSKQYGKLSVLVQSNMKVRKLLVASPNSFFPAPKVHSVVLLMQPLQDNFYLFSNLNYITSTLFQKRRKTIRSIIKDSETLLSAFNSVDLSLRPENISVNQFLELAKSLEKIVLSPPL